MDGNSFCSLHYLKHHFLIMTTRDIRKDLALAIVGYLTSSIHDGSISTDDADSVQVAIECLQDVFGLDQDQQTPDNLLNIYKEYQDKQPKKPEVSDALKAKAEYLKLDGNRAMASRSYSDAVDFYTKAIALNPYSPIYYANRAAAYSSLKEQDNAIADANKALELDPSYAKAYSRLGLAYYAKGEARLAMEAYEKGLALEGDKQSEAMKKGYETAKKRVAEEPPKQMEDTSSDDDGSATPEPETREAEEGSTRAAGSAFPDLSTLMNNPQLANMAQRLMSNPGAIGDLLSNPQVQQMASNMRGGNMNMGDILNNPLLQDLAKSFMSGGAGGAPK